MKLLNKEDILRGLHKIDEKAKKRGVVVDLAIYGGSALTLIFDGRQVTRDVDAVLHQSLSWFKDAIKEIAKEESWDDDWMNDGVKGFLSSNEDLLLSHFFDTNTEQGGLRVYVPTPEYLLAMKCMSMRIEGIEESHDISDIKFLIKKTGICSAQDIFNLIESFYPNSRIQPKTQFGIEEIMEKINTEKYDTP